MLKVCLQQLKNRYITKHSRRPVSRATSLVTETAVLVLCAILFTGVITRGRIVASRRRHFLYFRLESDAGIRVDHALATDSQPDRSRNSMLPCDATSIGLLSNMPKPKHYIYVRVIPIILNRLYKWPSSRT